VVFHPDCDAEYTCDPAAEAGRLEAIHAAIAERVEWITPEPAPESDILAVHTPEHVDWVRRKGLYEISALAAGGAIRAAEIGLTEPCFGLIRPPGHHASAGSSWGFCYFNNMAVALTALKNRGAIRTAYVLDFDLHYGDGTVNILGHRDWVKIHNPEEYDRHDYIRKVGQALSGLRVDIIGISAGFDNHKADWGGLLATDDYFSMGMMVRKAADAAGGGCFAILEGGYNFNVLGRNAAALLDGMS